MTEPVEWAQTRRSLMLELAALPGEGDVVLRQRKIADAIIDAEHVGPGVDRSAAKRRRHLLRVITDGLVHTLLPEHTIRSLSRHPGKPASLSAQGADFDFVIDQAHALRRLGLIPIVADLTTLIGVGDLVGWNGDGIIVVECKNRPAPQRQATTGRLARQRQRGEQVETYLTTSSVNEAENLVRQAVPFALPEPEWELVADLLARCDTSPSGVASWTLGTDDVLMAATAQATPEEFVAAMPVAAVSDHPAMAWYSELTDNATYRLRAPSSYPVGGTLRWRLLEGDLRLVRFVDLGRLAASFDYDGTTVRLIPERVDGRLDVRVDLDGEEWTRFTHQIAEFCLWMPVGVDWLRRALVAYSRSLVAEREPDGDVKDSLEVASGDNFSTPRSTGRRDESVGVARRGGHGRQRTVDQRAAGCTVEPCRRPAPITE